MFGRVAERWTMEADGGEKNEQAREQSVNYTVLFREDSALNATVTLRSTFWRIVAEYNTTG